MAAYVRPSAVLLAIPHVAFATSALLLFADGGCFMTISHISLRQWTNWVLAGLYPGGERKRISAVDLSGSLSEKRLLQQLIVLDSLGYSRGNA